MKILARYLSGIFLKNLFISSLSLTAMFFLLALLGDVGNTDFPPGQLFAYHAMDIPHIFVQVMPPAVLMATLLTLAGISRTNELIACYSIGIGLRQIMVVILSIVFMTSCFVLVLQDRIIPPLFKKRTTYYWRVLRERSDFFLDVKQDKIWYRSNNLIYNLRSYDPKTNSIIGMAVYTFDSDFNLIQVLNAKKATYTPNGWKLKDGTVTVFSEKERFPLSKKFDERELVISEKPKDFLEIEKEVDGLRLKELTRYIRRTSASGVDTKSYEVKFHSRISLSFIPLVMCILAVTFATRRSREGGIVKDVAICLVITFFYWLFYSVGLSLGTNGALPPWLAAWLPSLIFVALAAALISYRRQ